MKNILKKIVFFSFFAGFIGMLPVEYAKAGGLEEDPKLEMVRKHWHYGYGNYGDVDWRDYIMAPGQHMYHIGYHSYTGPDNTIYICPMYH